MALILLVVAIIVLILLFKGAKMWALVTNLAMQKIVKALTEVTAICSNYEYWKIKAWLSLIILGVMFLVIEKVHKMPIYRKLQYSNTIKILIFISNIRSYIPIKLCKTIGSIHLFKLTGSLQRDDIKLHRNKVWNVLEIDWKNITVTVNGQAQ